MALRILTLVAVLNSVACAVQYDVLAPTVAMGFGPRGRGPRPTAAPNIRQLFQRDLTNTCAYVNGSPDTCGPNLYCAYVEGGGPWGCCPVSSDGSFKTDCNLATVCLDQAAKSSVCGSADCPARTVWCGDPAAPECLTVVLPASAFTATWTKFACRSAQAAAVVTASGSLVTSTASSPTSTSSIPTTSSLTLAPPPSSSSSPSSSSATTESTTSSSTEAIVTPTPTTDTPTIAPTAGSTSAEPAAATSSSPAQGHDGGGKSDTGTIVGGAVGGAAGLVIIAAAIGFIVYRVRVKRREAEYSDDVPEMTGSPSEFR